MGILFYTPGQPNKEKEVLIARLNAEAVLSSIECMPAVSAGSWIVADLANVRSRIIRLLNSDRMLSRYVRAPKAVRREDGVVFLEMGLDVGLLRAKLTQLIELVAYAQSVKSEIHWGLAL